MLASIAAIGSLGHGDFLKVMADLAPHLGAQGGDFRSALARLEAEHGSGSAQLILGTLLDPDNPVAAVISAVDPDAGRTLVKHHDQFAGCERSSTP
jgi:hypothetical protein